nr:IS30 family transposase [Mycoplasmopsis canis]WQQ12088.1 IS30 family transposase [Mycoplasmopsis canis]WQQ12201.1 IS30 family transposase [Mycoplasmopsis canis]WQQ12300.1 IS30 family transposase [Mycoplasmopsis canis]WQQ12392.1 IS30 family transposase [Mycoplasmopsis canis]
MKNLGKWICIFDQSKKENKYTHYEIAENIDTIWKFQGKLELTRNLQKKQMDIDSIYNALFEISQGISIQKASKKIKRDVRTIKNKIDLMTSKYSKDLLKYQRFQCNNCFKRVTKVKVLHFSKMYDHLLNYRYSRLFLRNTKLQEKWEPFKEYWNDIRHRYNKYKIKRNIKEKAPKTSVKFLVNSFKKFHIGFSPSVSAVYKKMQSLPFYLDYEHIIRKSEGKYIRKTTRKTKSVTLNNATEIAKRPNYINDRSEMGHYELDTVMGKIDDKKCLVTLLERQTRKSYATITKRGSKYIHQALNNMIKKFDLNIKTLTVDNGKENVLLHKIIPKERLFKCLPYSSWQKGSIENMHRLIRYFIPKGKSLDNYTQEEIDFLMEWINNYRKIINQP